MGEYIYEIWEINDKGKIIGDKPIYIGKTNNPEARFNQHKSGKFKDSEGFKMTHIKGPCDSNEHRKFMEQYKMEENGGAYKLNSDGDYELIDGKRVSNSDNFNKINAMGDKTQEQLKLNKSNYKGNIYLGEEGKTYKELKTTGKEGVKGSKLEDMYGKLGDYHLPTPDCPNVWYN
ncbi:MAG: GIY-YIG nuclease family protein [Mycoplasmatales bacterium]